MNGAFDIFIQLWCKLCPVIIGHIHFDFTKRFHPLLGIDRINKIQMRLHSVKLGIRVDPHGLRVNKHLALCIGDFHTIDLWAQADAIKIQLHIPLRPGWLLPLDQTECQFDLRAHCAGKIFRRVRCTLQCIDRLIGNQFSDG